MEEKNHQLTPKMRFGKGLALALMTLLLCAMQAPAALTSAHYLNFTDGKVYVFPDSCISRLKKSGGLITITARDGKVYTYSTDSIASMTEAPVKELPTFTSFKFQRKFNHQLVSDAAGIITDNDIHIQVAGIGKRLTATFELSDPQAWAIYNDSVVFESQSSRVRYDGNRIIKVGYPSDLILAREGQGTYIFKPYGREYRIPVTYFTDEATDVPRIDINTVDSVDISSKEFYVDAEIVINGMGVFPSMTDSVKIKGRGNSSWSEDPKAKNPYRLKFASKVKPLGLTKGKNWVLIANKNKGSMLTNAYGMKAASLIGTPAANHIIPVNLYVNGTYKGSYNFTEKVGLANNSVDLDSENVAALLELDTYYDEPEEQKFMSDPYGLPVNIKEPEFGEDETSLDLGIIQERFATFVKTVATGGSLEDQVDIDYLARYLMTSDLICNKEIFYPKSVFCYNADFLDPGSKFIFGPIWDLDWGFGYTGDKYTYFVRDVTRDFYASTTHMEQNVFFSALRHNPKVVRRLKELWQEFMENGIDELCEFCDDYYQYAKPSLELSTTVAPDPINYGTQSVNAANWLRNRANYIYGQIQREKIMIGDADGDDRVSISDASAIIDYLMGTLTAVKDKNNADINDDGHISLLDLTELIDMLLIAP